MIVGMRYVATHEGMHHDDDSGLRVQRGRVEILYDDGTIDSFVNVDRGRYFRWLNNGFHDDDRPSQVELRDEDDDDDEDEEELVATAFGYLTEDEVVRLERLYACPILRLN